MGVKYIKAYQKIDVKVGKLTTSASSCNQFKLIDLHEGVSLLSQHYMLTTVYTQRNTLCLPI